MGTNLEPLQKDYTKHFMLTETIIDQYLSEKVKQGVALNAIQKYKTALLSLHNWAGEHRYLTKELLAEWRHALEEQGYSKVTVQNRVAVVNGFLRAMDLRELCISRPQKNDLTGQKFGYLTVTGMTDKRQRRYVVWNCKCRCGKEIEALSSMLLEGKTTSCGCLNVEILSHANRYVDGTSLRQAMEDKPINKNIPSGYTGVYPKGSRWMARITYKKKLYHLGVYDTLEEAVKARSRAKELIMEDAQKLFEETDFMFENAPKKPQQPQKESEVIAQAATVKKHTREDK